MAEKLPFGEVASINRSPLFCSLNYRYWKARMKIFVESIDQGIWDAIENGPLIPKIEKVGSFTKKFGPNGLMKKVKRPNLIALPRIS